MAYQTTSKHPGGLCSSGKVFYREEWRARLAVLRAADPPEGWQGEWSPCKSYYRCPECRDWHLTHHEKPWDGAR